MVENFFFEYKRKICEEAGRLGLESFPVLTEELFSLYEKTGNRLEYERVYFERRKFLSVLAIAGGVSADRDGELAKQFEQKLEFVIQDICRETTWALPAHIDRSKDGWENTIDLFAAETAFYLAEISQIHRDHLSEETVCQVQQEVLRRVLMPFARSKRPYAFWEQCEMNWNAVCNGAIGCAALWLLQDNNMSELLEQIVNRVTENLPYYLEGFSKDGVCLEGPSYYTYGLTFYFAFCDLLQRFTGSDRDLLEHSRLEKIVVFLQKCYLPGGYTISFSDGNVQEKFRFGLQTFMAMSFDGVELPEVSLAAGPWDDDCYRYATLSRDIEWTRRYLEKYGEKNTKIDVVMNECTFSKEAVINQRTSIDFFPDAQWAIMRRANSAIAIKGGHNDEPHNHNDVGSVMYVADGNLLLTDLGAGEYTREYFGEGRYENLCCSSVGHSVPSIDGNGQKAGKEYRATEFNQMEDSVTLSIAQAYDLQEEESILRNVFLRAKDGGLVILDVFKLQEGRQATENFVTPICPEELEDAFILETSNRKYMVTCDAFTDKRIVEQNYRNHAGEEITVWMMQWDVPLEEVKIRIKAV